MLHELRSRPGHRWFSDADRDLYVWLDADERFTGFQLCYDKRSGERAITWRVGGSLEHASVNAGDELPTRNDAPELIALVDAVPLTRLREEFEQAGRTIDPAVYAFVMDVLSTNGGHRQRGGAVR